MHSRNIVRRLLFQWMMSSQTVISVLTTGGVVGSASVVTTFCCFIIYCIACATDFFMTDTGLHMLSTAKWQIWKLHCFCSGCDLLTKCPTPYGGSSSMPSTGELKLKMLPLTRLPTPLNTALRGPASAGPAAGHRR
jgi:hypothetical protein